MLANTKQVRAVGNAVAGFAARWTDATSEYNTQRRSVVWACVRFGTADAVAAKMREEFARKGYANAVKVTGGMYVRVIADLA